MFRILLFSLLLLSPLVSQKAFCALDFNVIKHSAQLSAISYAKPDLIGQRVPRLNYALVHHAELPGSAVSYYLARSASGLQQLAFRGTSNLENVMVDLDLQLQMDKSLGIQLHQGFSIAAKAAYENALPYLDKTKPVQTTGHSLGGAVAVIVSMYLQRDGFQLQQVITFGQPKVTNVAGANVFASLPLLRVVTPKDIVPLVPPLSPLQLNNIDIYWHLGKELILLADKNYAITEGFKSMLRATKFVSNVPDESNVQAHQIGTYLTVINQKLEGAQQVVYKTDMNLFGFSLD
ncbi:MAG: triacylglycerol lipase [Oleispira sp.]|jgi:triacylglycerol lipase